MSFNFNPRFVCIRSGTLTRESLKLDAEDVESELTFMGADFTVERY